MIGSFTVSVVLIAYNHGKYIKKALDSIFMQQTDFEFEVVVGEDCSTDNTRAILLEYKAAYPDRMTLLFREKNLGRPTLNVYQTIMACSGEYVAFLEGDDYWTDAHKLAEQVGFLRDHPEYIAVTHSCGLVDEQDREITDKVLDMYRWSGRYTFEDFKGADCWPGHYATVLCRNVFQSVKYDFSILYKAHDFLDDGVILLFLLLQGDIYRMDEVMSCWRYVKKKDGGNWNSLAMKRNLMVDDCYTRQKLALWCRQYRRISGSGKKQALADFDLALKYFLKKPNRENRKFLQDMFSGNVKEIVLEGRPCFLPVFAAGRLMGKLTGRR